MNILDNQLDSLKNSSPIKSFATELRVEKGEINNRLGLSFFAANYAAGPVPIDLPTILIWLLSVKEYVSLMN